MTSMANFIFENKIYEPLNHVFHKKRRLECEEKFNRNALSEEVLHDYIIALNPLKGPGKKIRFTVQQAVRNLKPNKMTLITDWDPIEAAREMWIAFVESNFPMKHQQEIVDVFLEVLPSKNKSNRCYNFYMQHCIHCDPDFIPNDHIELHEAYCTKNTAFAISLSKKHGGCRMRRVRSDFNDMSTIEFVRSLLWDEFHRPQVYLATDSGEEEEVYVELALIFVVKEFIPDAILTYTH